MMTFDSCQSNHRQQLCTHHEVRQLCVNHAISLYAITMIALLLVATRATAKVLLHATITVTTTCIAKLIRQHLWLRPASIGCLRLMVALGRRCAQLRHDDHGVNRVTHAHNCAWHDSTTQHVCTKSLVCNISIATVVGSAQTVAAHYGNHMPRAIATKGELELQF